LDHDLNAFRQHIRSFVQQHLPAELRTLNQWGMAPSREQLIAWHQVLAEHGLLVPHWPPQWGGQGWTVSQQMVFDEEMALAGAPELNSITFDMIGPVLARFGSPAQQQAFLPAIAAGTQWWAQGYSEPNSGSDLASLKTRARKDGDAYVVNGSKIWTSYAQYADWLFCLVRTDEDAIKPQQGISFLLIDMKTPGITVRPIVGIHGWVVFNEVFFDEVRVPADNLVGQENAGWTVAKALLEFERLKLARIGENKRRMKRARQLGDTQMDRGRLLKEQPWFRERFAQLQARLIALEANAGRFVERQKRGEPLGAEVGMLKLRGSRLVQAWEDLIVDALGMDASPLDVEFLQARTAPDGDFGLNQAIAATASSRRFLSRGYTIAGGSSEIQHNILAKQALGL
jgi:acyl-CoA dehydrogenase